MPTLRMRTILLAAGLVLASCGSIADESGAPTTGPATNGGGASAGPTLAVGATVVTVEGNVVKVTGRGDGKSETFPLSGSVVITSTTCASSAAAPFLWLYTEFGQGAGQYVDPENHVKNLKGNYYIQVASNADCVWTFTFTPE